MDLFSTISSNSSGSYNLATKIQSQFQAIAQKKAQAVAEDYSKQIAALQVHTAGLAKVDTSISSAITALQRAVDKIKTVKNALDNMSTAVKNYAATSNIDSAAGIYDSNLSVINSVVSDKKSDNLLGSVHAGTSYSPNSLTYISDSAGTQVTVTGAYSGVQNEISQPDGSFFVAKGVQTLQRYNAYPSGAVGYGISTSSTNVKLNSLTGNQISFTTGMSLAAASQQTFTGTLTSKGLSVLNAWMYNNFTTAADRDKAQTDITHAQGDMDVLNGTLSAALTAAQHAQDKENLVQSTTKKEVAALQDAAQSAQAKIQSDSQKQFNAIQQNLAGAGISANSNPFGGTSGSDLFSTLAAQPSSGGNVSFAQAQAQAQAVNPDAGTANLLSSGSSSSSASSLFSLLA